MKDIINARMAKRRRPEDINLKLEPAEEFPGWRTANKAEWQKIESSGAVKVIPLKESIANREELRRQGLHNRILPSRILRKYKHSE